MKIYSITKTASGSLEGKLSEFLQHSPFVPVQVAVLHKPEGQEEEEVSIFYKEKMNRREDTSLESVDYQSDDGTSLRLINDF